MEIYPILQSALTKVRVTFRLVWSLEYHKELIVLVYRNLLILHWLLAYSRTIGNEKANQCVKYGLSTPYICLVRAPGRTIVPGTEPDLKKGLQKNHEYSFIKILSRTDTTTSAENESILNNYRFPHRSQVMCLWGGIDLRLETNWQIRCLEGEKKIIRLIMAFHGKTRVDYWR